jgi:hypothetical protein
VAWRASRARGGGAGGGSPRPARGAHNLKRIDAHYEAIRVAMKGVFTEFRLAA